MGLCLISPLIREVSDGQEGKEMKKTERQIFTTGALVGLYLCLPTTQQTPTKHFNVCIQRSFISTKLHTAMFFPASLFAQHSLNDTGSYNYDYSNPDMRSSCFYSLIIYSQGH